MKVRIYLPGKEGTRTQEFNVSGRNDAEFSTAVLSVEGNDKKLLINPLAVIATEFIEDPE